MAWDPEPGFHEAVTALRENDSPSHYYSFVDHYGPRKRFGRRKITTVWRSKEVKIEGDLSSEKNRSIRSDLMKEAQNAALDFELEEEARAAE